MTHKQPFDIYIASCDANGGIYQYRMEESGKLVLISKTALDRPMYMTIEEQTFYAVLLKPFSDTADSGIVSFMINGKGMLENQSPLISTKGEVACHVTVKDGIAYCANYISGSIIKMPDNLVLHQGSNVHPVRQTQPHPHFVSFTPDKKYLLVADLGMDQILVYDENLNFISSVNMPKGHGARHLAFSRDGKTVFCANELGNTVSVLNYQEGRLDLVDTFAALEEGYTEESTIAAIRVVENTLYVSNRGHDSISCFEINGNKLTLFDIVPCGGRSPRDINITPDGEYMLCTNERSNTVTVLKINNKKLYLTDTKIELMSPLCIVCHTIGNCET